MKLAPLPKGSASHSDSQADASVVARVHAAVGEALTQRHATDEELGRPRMSRADERALSRKLIADELASLANEAYEAGDDPLDDGVEAAVAAAVFDRIHGLGRLQPLLDDPDIRDIHISGHDRVWLQLRSGAKAPRSPTRTTN